MGTDCIAHLLIFIVDHPNLDASVFVQVMETIPDNVFLPPRTDGKVIADEPSIMTLEKDSVFLMRYSAVRQLLFRRQIRLL